MNKNEKNSVLIVDDESGNIITLTHILSSEYLVYAATDGEEAIETAKEHLPGCILLDIIMEKMDGYEVLFRLKNDVRTRNIPVIFVTGLSNSEDEMKGLDLGAADYISKPFNPVIVKLRVRNLFKIINLTDTVDRLSKTDQLTGISNRRDFDYKLSLVFEHAKRGKKPLSICVMDVDNFKKYNDDYGHLWGDAALRTIAKTIENSLKRTVDTTARWGSEEFITLLPDTDLKGALSVAESIRKNIENLQFPSGGKSVNLTLSMGINTHTPKQGSAIRDFVAGADKALYMAKKEGKNKVRIYDGAEGQEQL
ncbi:MAG: diguanylate cyclase [Chitinispirillales bacterium]|jgi:diguanylate cyclase (GGDEF)-like protein|nr:diguanylate cyclase [Chitinispirillales bacterium]